MDLLLKTPAWFSNFSLREKEIFKSQGKAHADVLVMAHITTCLSVRMFLNAFECAPIILTEDLNAHLTKNG